MTSQNRIDANRRNALKSTGPRSASGKFKVRYNALWHGAFAADLLFPGENPRAFATLRRLRRFYQPANEEEEIIVNRIFLAAWRLQRLAAMESRVLRSHAEAHSSDVELRTSIANMVSQRYLPPDDEEAGDDEPTDSGPSDPIASAWNRDTGGGNTLVKLARYQFGLERALYRSIRQLYSRRGHPDKAPAT